MRYRPRHFTTIICLCLSVTFILYLILDNKGAKSLFHSWLADARAQAIICSPSGSIQILHDDPNVVSCDNVLIMAPAGSRTVQSTDDQRKAFVASRQMRLDFRAASRKIKSASLASAYFALREDKKDQVVKNSKLRAALIATLHAHRRARIHKPIISLHDVLPESQIRKIPIWDKYHFLINERSLPMDKTSIDHVLHVLRHGEVSEVDEIEKGTQVKLRVTFSDGTVAVVKPMRVSRMYQTPPDHFYFSDIERHNAEIAAFHLDRILQFYRAPPTIGRVFNISEEIKPHALEDLLATFFISPAGNVCFRGQCKYYCDTSHAVCGKDGHMMEASVQLFLPVSPDVTWVRMMHPYRRSYSAKHLAEWETNPDYCAESVFVDENFQSRLILDMVDSCVFDFLMGNLDRHHLVKIDELGSNSTTFHIDQGRGFGRYNDDDFTILAPLTQCCLIRYSTMKTLSGFSESGPSSLGHVLRRSLDADPIKPVLLEEHYDAVNRRLAFIFYYVKQCVRKVGDITKVVIDDGL